MLILSHIYLIHFKEDLTTSWLICHQKQKQDLFDTFRLIFSINSTHSLTAIKNFNAPHVNVLPPIITTKQRYLSIKFHQEDFMNKMAGRCWYTLVGNFINSMPKMDVIRKSFIAQTHLIGNVKIAHYYSRHIYIDFDNEVDHINVLTKKKMFIAGHSMKIQM